RCLGLQGPAVRMQLLRQQGRRPEIPGDAGQGRQPAVAADAQGTHGWREDGCRRRARVLRAAAGMAEAAERGPDMRMQATASAATPTASPDAPAPNAATPKPTTPAKG